MPAELRNKIYELVLCLPGQGNGNVVTIIPHTEVYFPGLGPRTSPTVLDLLLVCRQIHSEAEPIFYALNHLRYHTINPTFLLTLSPRRQKALSAVTLNARRGRSALQELIRNLLPLATNLHVLHIELPIIAWKSDGEAMAWAREVQVALRTTKVKVVRIVHSERQEVLASLNTGGSANNSYVFISHRAKLERARELNLTIESMLRGIVED
jgi:hypothetical protein